MFLRNILLIFFVIFSYSMQGMNKQNTLQFYCRFCPHCQQRSYTADTAEQKKIDLAEQKKRDQMEYDLRLAELEKRLEEFELELKLKQELEGKSNP